MTDSLRPRVLFADHHLKDIALEREIFAAAGIDLHEAQCQTQADVIREARGCCAALITYAPMDREVFEACPELGLVSRMGAGYDTVVLDDARAAGVWVANSPDYGVGEVSLHALSMLLALIRRLPALDDDIRRGTWHFQSAGTIPRAQEMTVGVLGLGRIGKRFAHYAQPIFKRVIAHDPHLIDGDFPQYVERVGLEALFEQADAISIHCLLNDETRGIVGDALLARMKPQAYLVNTARGAIVDVDALTRTVAAGRLAGVGLDVLPIEPVPPDHPLLVEPRVLFTPHSAFYSVTSEQELRRKAAMNIVQWIQHGRPAYPVVVGTRSYTRA